MRVSVHTRGGALGLNRRVEVDEGEMTISERGTRQTVTLAAEQWSRVDEAADQVASMAVPTLRGYVDLADTGYSDIEITDDIGTTSLRVPVGADAPDEVWFLLEILEETIERLDRH